MYLLTGILFRVDPFWYKNKSFFHSYLACMSNHCPSKLVEKLIKLLSVFHQALGMLCSFHANCLPLYLKNVWYYLQINLMICFSCIFYVSHGISNYLLIFEQHHENPSQFPYTKRYKTACEPVWNNWNHLSSLLCITLISLCTDHTENPTVHGENWGLLGYT